MWVSVGTFAQRSVSGIWGISNLSRYRKDMKSVKVNITIGPKVADNRNALDKGWWAVEGKSDHCGK
jgi:hypothetical protein